MFPDIPNMICRRCAHSFQLTEEMRREAQSIIRFECPFCKYETVGSGVRAFLEFYPRLVRSEKQLATEGVSLVGYGIGDIMGMGLFSWLKEEMQYQCNSCSHIWSAPFDPDTLYYKKYPKLFRCPSCFQRHNSKIVKEFFMSLNQTFEGAFKFTHVQWDIFSPVGYAIPTMKIQSKRYTSKFPI